VIVVANILLLAGIVAWVVGLIGKCAPGMIYLANLACENERAVRAIVGVGMIIVFWFLEGVILSILWLVRGQKGRCPACGTRVKERATICPKCGRVLRAAASGPSPPIPPAPM
jgi:hypothetical protein